MKNTNKKTGIQVTDFKLDTKKMVIVDLNSGSYNLKNVGHELFNLTKNPIDERYYGYCPPYDGITINKLGAGNKDNFIEGILIVYVTKKSNSNNRVIIAFTLNATVYRKGQPAKDLCRKYIDNDGIEKSATYSISSDNMFDLSQRLNKFEIKINDHSNKMFRMQRVYGGTYPILDKQIISYIENNLENKQFLDDDNNEDQEEIQNSEPAHIEVLQNSSNKPLAIVNSSQGRIISKDSRISKSALKESNYLCEVNHNHKTFITKRNVPYMEGHHLIPCTVSNSEYFMEKFKKNIDCFENVVSLCPNCHRELHYGEWTTKSIKLKIIFDKYRFKLHKIGVIITENELLSLYKHD